MRAQHIPLLHGREPAPEIATGLRSVVIAPVRLRESAPTFFSHRHSPQTCSFHLTISIVSALAILVVAPPYPVLRKKYVVASRSTASTLKNIDDCQHSIPPNLEVSA